MFLTDTLANMSQNIFAYSFISEQSKHFFLFREKNLHFLEAGGVWTPPLLADVSTKNESFFVDALAYDFQCRYTRYTFIENNLSQTFRL